MPVYVVVFLTYGAVADVKVYSDAEHAHIAATDWELQNPVYSVNTFCREVK